MKNNPCESTKMCFTSLLNRLNYLDCKTLQVCSNKNSISCFDYVMNIFSFGEPEFIIKKKDQGNTEIHSQTYNL